MPQIAHLILCHLSPPIVMMDIKDDVVGIAYQFFIIQSMNLIYSNNIRSLPISPVYCFTIFHLLLMISNTLFSIYYELFIYERRIRSFVLLSIEFVMRMRLMSGTGN